MIINKRSARGIEYLRKSAKLMERVAQSSTGHMRAIGLRAGGVIAALLTNLLVARHLTLDQVAFYYLYMTLAYIGNAGLYVGLSIILQRFCAPLAIRGELDKAFFLRFLLFSLSIGMTLVMLIAASYLILRRSEVNPWKIAAWCSVLSGANYLSLTGKDVLALGKRLDAAASCGLLEQLLRLIFVALVLQEIQPSAINVVAAGVLAALIAGVGAIVFLLLIFKSGVAVINRFTMREALHTITPIGISGLLNWTQLQAYRPALLLFGNRPESIGIAALLTTLGITGANPVLSIIAQNHIPRFYGGDPDAFRKCVSAILRVAFLLTVIAVPAAMSFLLISGRKALMMYVLLVPLGVLVEAGNNVIGAFMHRRNAVGKSMWMLTTAGIAGVLVAVCSWSIHVSSGMLPYLIGTAMVLSQLATVLVLAKMNKRYAGL